jgi:hypothetical protein
MAVAPSDRPGGGTRGEGGENQQVGEVMVDSGTEALEEIPALAIAHDVKRVDLHPSPRGFLVLVSGYLVYSEVWR